MIYLCVCQCLMSFIVPDKRRHKKKYWQELSWRRLSLDFVVAELMMMMMTMARMMMLKSIVCQHWLGQCQTMSQSWHQALCALFDGINQRNCLTGRRLMHRLFDHQDIVAKKVQSAIVYKENERIGKNEKDTKIRYRCK